MLIFAALITRLWFLQVLATDQFAALAQTRTRSGWWPSSRSGGRSWTATGTCWWTTGRRSSSPSTRRSSATIRTRSWPAWPSSSASPRRICATASTPSGTAPIRRSPSPRTSPRTWCSTWRSTPTCSPACTTSRARCAQYPDGTLAAHILGYVGQISQDQLDSQDFHGYRPGEDVGKSGVEAYYDRFLYGVRGKRGIQVNAQGEVLNSEFQILDPKGGDNLVLTIDRDVQRLAEQALADGIQLAQSTPVNEEDPTATFNAPGGAVVVMDPHNGQVVAMASYPTFDPSIFVDGVSTDEAALLNDPTTTPQLNRAIQGQYPPGSTFKPFIAAGALHEKFASLTGSYDCPAEWEVPADFQHTKFHNWDPIDQGPMSLSQALVQLV